MSETKLKIDLEKMKQDVTRELQRVANKGIDSLSNADKQFIGDTAVYEMKGLISKGISPIADAGRFPGYKWVGRANQALKIARGLTKSRRKSARDKAKSISKNKYPYSAQKDFPGKKVRPVNLLLSGKFLANLLVRARPRGISIGFFSQPYIDIEGGHRTGGAKGVNDQPQRPIIPQGSEQLSRSIYQKLVTALRDRIIKRLESLSKD